MKNLKQEIIKKHLIKKINFFILLFFLNILFISFNLSSKEITNSDVFSYFENPIFQDLWFGIYDKKGIKYGWSNFNEYQKGNSWIFNFIITYIIIIFFINLINFFYIQKNHYNVESSKAFSEELYFTNNEVKNILKKLIILLYNLKSLIKWDLSFLS